MSYFLSFVEECVMSPAYVGYMGGRIEVHPKDSEAGYASEEIRFLTRRIEDFSVFRDRYDFECVDVATLEVIRGTVSEKFRDMVE